jgi:hypothetical protein
MSKYAVIWITEIPIGLTMEVTTESKPEPIYESRGVKIRMTFYIFNIF